MSENALRAGVGYFQFVSNDAPLTMRVFYACPHSDLRKAPIIIAMHGMDRAAEAFRNDMAAQALKNGQIVLVPEFDVQRFPDHFAYNFGGVCLAPPSGTVFPRDQWNFGIIDRLFQFVRHALGSSRTTFGMYGNSAGAQYVLRYLALTDAPDIDLAIASNSGVYMAPDLTSAYPIGMGRLDLKESHVRRYLGRRLILLIGRDDTDTSAPDLPRMDYAIAQGPHRLARGQWYIEHCSQLARQLGVPFGWKMEVVEGAGHISSLIFSRAADLLHNCPPEPACQREASPRFAKAPGRVG